MLGDGRLGDVEARGEVLHSGLSTGETFEDGASAWIRQGAEDGVLALHEETYKRVLMECQASGYPRPAPSDRVSHGSWRLSLRDQLVATRAPNPLWSLAGWGASYREPTAESQPCESPPARPRTTNRPLDGARVQPLLPKKTS